MIIINVLQHQCQDGEFEVEYKLYTIDCKRINNDSYFIKNAINLDKLQFGFLCVYSDQDSLEYLKKAFKNVDIIADYIPIFIIFIYNQNTDSSRSSPTPNEDFKLLEQSGQNLADCLNCIFVQKNVENMNLAQLVTECLQQFVDMYHKSDELIELYQSVINCCEPDIR